jgi:glycogen debranching enzyme
MISINKKKYADKIKHILMSTSEAVLTDGVVGGVPEVSSAKERTGYGCLSQAWSNAFFLDLVEEFYGGKE